MNLLDKKIEEWNRTKPDKYPTFSYSFVGETSKEAEIELQTKLVLALMDVHLQKIYT